MQKGEKRDCKNGGMTYHGRENSMLIDKLKELKAAKNMTVQQISDLSGVPASTVSRIFSGQTDNPTFQNISDIVVAMGGSMDEIIGIAQAPKEHKEYDAQTLLLQSYHKRIEDKEAEAKRLQKEKKILFYVFLVLVFIVVFVMIFDIVNPNVGYVRY